MNIKQWNNPKVILCMGRMFSPTFTSTLIFWTEQLFMNLRCICFKDWIKLAYMDMVWLNLISGSFKSIYFKNDFGVIFPLLDIFQIFNLLW